MAEIVMIPVDKIYPHPDNPRKNIGDVTELAASIKAKGVLQNLTVVPGHWMSQAEWMEVSARYKENPTEEDCQTMNRKWLDTGCTVIIGHRRLAAAKLAGLTEVPCVIADLSPREQFDTMMVENVQRADLTIYEQAQGFQMMLDMGGTVESVAEQTGFSQTTVRNRLKLMKLDQDKLKQSMEREASLSDYIELDKIEDENTRNKVLEAIGTTNFRSELSSALAKQEIRHKIAGWVELVAPFAEKVDKQDTSTMEYCKCFNRYQNGDDFQKPEDAVEVKYFYRIEKDYGVYLYRERKQGNDPEAERRKREREAEQAEYDRKKAEFEEITDRHHDLRTNFLMEFGASKKKAPNIMIFALQTIVRITSYGFYTDWQLIADMLDIRMDDEQKKVDPEEYAAVIKESPEYALLVTAYATLSKDSDKYWDWQYNGNVRCFVHKANDKLDLIYQMLTQLGYEMSDEEKEMQDGTHELFENTDEDMADDLDDDDWDDDEEDEE